jgi:hypothetical protein
VSDEGGRGSGDAEARSGDDAEEKLPAPAPTSGVSALIAEACKKSSVIWISLPDLPQPRAAWHVWHEDAVLLVSGAGEQRLPGLDRVATATARATSRSAEDNGRGSRPAATVEVTVRSKDKGGRLLRFIARVRALEPGTEQWAAAAAELLGNRLNLPDGDAAVQRWARESLITRLEPTGELLEQPGSLSAESHAAPPLPSPATTSARKPLVIGRRARRRN